MLKQLMLGKKIEQRKNELTEIIEKENDLETRTAAAETAIDEAETDEELSTIEEETANIEKEKEKLLEKKGELEGSIAELEGELEKLKSKEPTATPKPETEKEARGGFEMTRTKIFNGMTREEVESIVNREEVKDFAERTRSFYGQNRDITGAELLVPDVLLGILRDNVALSSKLLSKVNYKPLKGKARQNITGTVPEAVWTEMVGALNELKISFNQVEVDGYKVGGYIAIPNSILQDSDINLVEEVLNQLSKAIGIALDKAILYGTGIKQPLGIVPRLEQQSKPDGYSANAPKWADLHTSNVKSINATGAALIGAIVENFGATKNNFSNGNKFFAMNSQTYAFLTSTLLNFNAAGALATGMNNTMPILGGEIVILDFMSDNDIVGGYGDLYLLVEREGTGLGVSEHVKFTEDQTVFKGIARYDGLPVIAEGFISMNIKNSTAAASKVFPSDTANPEMGTLTITSAAGSAKNDTDITMSGGQTSGTFFGYIVADKAKNVKYGEYHTGYTPVTFTSGEATLTVGAANNNKYITVVEFYYGMAIAAGSKKLTVKTTD